METFLVFKVSIRTFAPAKRWIMKETILKKATEMFLTLGFKSVTMDDIAASLGISKKTIYQHYANKIDLVNASAIHLYMLLSEGVDKIIARDLNAIAEMFAIRDFVLENLNDESASPIYQLNRFFPEISENLKTIKFRKMHTSMVANLKKGIKGGLYRPEINIDFMSRIYFTGLTGIKDNDIFPPDIYKVKETTNEYLEYHIRGIATDTGLDTLTHLLKNTIKN